MADDPWKPNEGEIERRKREILANARDEAGYKPPGTEGGKAGQSGGEPSAMVGLGVQFVVTILVCLFTGQWLDRRLGTAPWMLLAGVLLGGAVGFWTMLRVAKAQEKAQRPPEDGKE